MYRAIQGLCAAGPVARPMVWISATPSSLSSCGDLPMEVQIKLLRTLQERELERVGGNETIKVDVRVVSATNRNLEKMIEEGEFREDLYYRLNVFPINLPPLRDRLDDLPVLANHFVAKFARAMGMAPAGLSPEGMAKLREYNWPGNVRELENIIERAMILSRGLPLAAVHLDFVRRSPTQSSGAIPIATPAAASGPAPVATEDGKSLAERLLESERKEIVAAVEKSRATSRARHARSASIVRRCTTGCASTVSSTCCRRRSRSAARKSSRRLWARLRPARPPSKSPGLRYSARVRALFILDPLEKLGLAGDTSYGLMLEAAARSWEIWTCQLEHLGLVGNDAVVDAVPTQVVDAAMPAQAFTIGERAARRLADFDIVLMRKDPPVDVNYLHATWILDHARGKTLLVNDPRGLRELNEHLAVLNFPHLTPPTIVTRSPERLRAFQAEQAERSSSSRSMATAGSASSSCAMAIRTHRRSSRPRRVRARGGRSRSGSCRRSPRATSGSCCVPANRSVRCCACQPRRRRAAISTSAVAR